MNDSILNFPLSKIHNLINLVAKSLLTNFTYQMWQAFRQSRTTS